jgi:hypothetical protein
MQWINRYKYYILLLLCTAMLVYGSSLSSEQTHLERARSADAFIDSIGVAVHLNYEDTAYGQYDNIIKPRLQELGVRHIRGSVRLKEIETQQKFLDLAAIGIKSTLVIDPRRVKTIADAIKIAKAVAGSVEALEGPNEWDLRPKLKYEGQTFPEGVRNFQAALYSAIKKDSATSHLEVLSPSLADPHKASELGSVACDHANIHSYPYKDSLPTSGLDEKWLPAAGILCPNKPIVATECGYHNAINRYGVSEQAAGKYLPRLFLEYFNRGIKRAYSYELIDLKPNPAADEPELNYGLLRHDGSPKPAFMAMKNAIALLKEPAGTNAHLNFLDYTLKGNTNEVHHTLLQKRDGTFYLILWQEVYSYSVRNKREIFVKDRPLQLILNTPITQAKLYQPSNSLNPIAQYINPQQIDIQVPDYPLAIALVPTKN